MSRFLPKIPILSRQFQRNVTLNSTIKLSTPKSKAKHEFFFYFATSIIFFSGGYLFGQYNKENQLRYQLLANHPIEETFPFSSTTKLSSVKSPIYAKDSLIFKAIEEIKEIVGEANVENNPQSKDDHSDTYWNSHHAKKDERPMAIIYPNSTLEVSKIMNICFQYNVPVIPFSGGTSLEGHFIPTKPGICIDLNHMNEILELNDKDLDVVVQPGVSWEDLGDYLDDKNLMFSGDPGPTAEIGGMIATSCSGTNAYRYGTIKENVINLTVVLSDGTIIKTKKRPRKSSAGYNLTNLFTGSEGTLGIVTEATLKLHVKPKFENVVVINYPNIENAAKTVEEMIEEGIQVNAVELLDDEMMKCINKSGQLSNQWQELPTLFLKIGGNTENSIKEVIRTIEKISNKNHQSFFKFAKSEDEKFELWQARKVALWSTIDFGKQYINKDIQLWTTDVAVPVSRLSKVLKETKEDLKKSGLVATLVGHVGDGNFHSFILYEKDQRKIAERLVDKMVERALDNDGTCTGEHGVGMGKRDYLLEELGEEPINLMRKIKLAIDPKRILNADKIFKIDPKDLD